MRNFSRFAAVALFLFACATIATAQPVVNAGAPATHTVKAPEPTAADLAKSDLADRVLRDAQQQMGNRTIDPQFKAQLMQHLMGMSSDSLVKLLATGHALQPVTDTLGSATNDMVYTPLAAPCRVYDTRPASGYQGQNTGPLAAGTPVGVVVASYCGVPYPQSKAVMLNFVAASPAGAGNLRAWVWDSSAPPAPNSSIINYNAAMNLANGVVVPICNIATATGGNCATYDIFIEPFNSATHVVIDVLGYFAAPAPTALDTSDQSVDWTAAPQTFVNIVTPACPAGYTLTGGSAKSWGGVYGGTAGMYLSSDGASGSAWQCIGYNNQPTGGGTWTGTCTAHCRRIP